MGGRVGTAFWASSRAVESGCAPMVGRARSVPWPSLAGSTRAIAAAQPGRRRLDGGMGRDGETQRARVEEQDEEAFSCNTDPT